MSNLEMSEH